jgi:hypothetical protein
LTFGWGHEVPEIPADHLNGFGSNFWPETVGQGIAMIEHMRDVSDHVLYLHDNVPFCPL